MKLFAQWWRKRLNYRQNNSQLHNITLSQETQKNPMLFIEGASW